MSNVNNKLKDFFTFKDLNLSNVEFDCGFSKNSLRKSFDRGSAIGSDKLMIILATYPELSAEWLMRGKGEMIMADNNTTTNSNNLNSILGNNNNSSDVIKCLISQLSKKDEQISSLIAKIGNGV